MNKKISLLIISIAIVSALFLLIYIVNKEDKELFLLNKTGLLIKDLNIDMLELRRNEKDFLARNEKIYLKKFNQNYSQIKKHISHLSNNLKHENIDNSLLLLFSDSLTIYENSFHRLVDIKISFGLSEKYGEYYKLRTTAHKLIKFAQTNKELLSEVLELRRNEKDFLLRKDLSYVKKFEKIIRDIYSMSSNKETRDLVTQYHSHFLHLVKLQKEIGLNEGLGHTKVMRSSVHNSETTLSTLSKQLTSAINEKHIQLILLTKILLVTVFVIVIFIIILFIVFITSDNKVNQLTQLYKELKKTLDELELTQRKLMESEKLASLGGLVAGVAHEINTPLGIALTGITYFDEMSRKINQLYKSEDMTEEKFEKFLIESEEISNQILNSINRAADLIRLFKQVSVDQTNEVKREFYINDYVEGIIISINNQLKKTQITIDNQIPVDIKINNYPGAFGQIITNLILNSITHAYTNDEIGLITINLETQKSKLILHYKDDGKGIKESDLAHIFDPFFTTNRGSGGTGLGLNILHNIVKKQLKGEIECISKPMKGVHFIITIPV